jgi:hypothetical protein
MLRPLQRLLETIYDAPSGQDVRDFLLTAREKLPRERREAAAEEELVLVQKRRSCRLALYIDDAVLARLHADMDRQVVEAAMINARLTEASIVRALREPRVPVHTVDIVSRTPRWSARHDVRFALIRSRHTPLARVLTFLQTMNREDVRMLASDPAVPPQVRSYLARRG